ncbi:hypothetical protein ACLD0W_12765 [Alloalcanivorax sp. C16-1]|uniref:hypothetical protein n=1 Tax=Alloalcanivorax sp. C16-1 TaxID=3390051 RepID=UPI00397111B0
MNPKPTTPYAKRRQQQKLQADIARYLEAGGPIRQFEPHQRAADKPRIANRVQQRKLDAAELH